MTIPGSQGYPSCFSVQSSVLLRLTTWRLMVPLEGREFVIATLPRSPMPKKPKRNDVPVKIDAEVLRMLRVVCAWDNVPLAELLSEIARPILQRRMEKIKDAIPDKPKDR